MLNFIYYPVSAIMWVWHKAFGFVLGGPAASPGRCRSCSSSSRCARSCYKPFVQQVRSMRKMQEFQPEIKKLQKKYGNDRQKLAAEMQKLQKEHGRQPARRAACRPGAGAGVHRPVPRAAVVQPTGQRGAAHRELLLRPGRRRVVQLAPACSVRSSVPG